MSVFVWPMFVSGRSGGGTWASQRQTNSTQTAIAPKTAMIKPMTACISVTISVRTSSKITSISCFSGASQS